MQKKLCGMMFSLASIRSEDFISALNSLFMGTWGNILSLLFYYWSGYRRYAFLKGVLAIFIKLVNVHTI